LAPTSPIRINKGRIPMEMVGGQVQCVRNEQIVYGKAFINGFLTSIPYGYPGAYSWVAFLSGHRPPTGRFLFSALTDYHGHFRTSLIPPPGGQAGVNAPMPSGLLADSHPDIQSVQQESRLADAIPLYVHLMLNQYYGYNVQPQNQRFLWLMNVNLHAAPGFQRVGWKWGRAISGDFWFKLPVV